MKSSRSVSCRAPLKSDAMVPHCRPAPRAGVTRCRETVKRFRHAAGKRPHGSCATGQAAGHPEGARPLLATPGTSHSPPSLGAGREVEGRRGGGEARAPPSRSRAHLPARCAAPAVSAPGEMQPTSFTWFQTQPKNPEGRRVRRDAQFLLKREENESDGDGKPFLPRLRLSAEPWGSRRESAVISKTSLRKLHFPVRFYYLRQNRCWLDSVLELSCTGNDHFLWDFTENASDRVWHIPGTHVGPALKVPWQDQPQNTPRAGHDLTCWGPIPACALLGVLVLMWALPGDSSPTCGLTVTSRCLRPRCWCGLLQHLPPLLVAPRMGTFFSAARGAFTRGCTWWASRPQHPLSWQYLTKVWGMMSEISTFSLIIRTRQIQK